MRRKEATERSVIALPRSRCETFAVVGQAYLHYCEFAFGKIAMVGGVDGD